MTGGENLNLGMAYHPKGVTWGPKHTYRSELVYIRMKVTPEVA